jgi:MFS family permease
MTTDPVSALPPARRRRQRRRLIPNTPDERATLLEGLAERAYPTVEFFIFSLLAGAILGAGYLLDSQALLFVGVLLVPLLMPWLGMTLATVTGSWRFFFQTLAAFVIGAVLIFITGLLAGFAARAFMPLTLSEAFYHSRLWWPHLLVLVLGAVLLPISFVRSERRPVLPSAMLAFAFYLPLSAAAVGLGSGVPGIWPSGLIVFLIHFGLASLIAVVTLVIMGFRPYTLAGYSLGTALILAGILGLVLLSGFGSALASQFDLPGLGSTATPTQPPLLPTPTGTGVPSATATPQPATATPTQTGTPTASLLVPTPETPTGTPLPNPTPVYALIESVEGDGIAMRVEPGGALLTTLLNGILVEVISDVQRVDNFNWVKVRAVTGGGTFEGWVIQNYLRLATPSPNWSPSPTP